MRCWPQRSRFSHSMGLICSLYGRSMSTESGSGFVIPRSILWPAVLLDLSEAGTGLFRPFNPRISWHLLRFQRHLKNKHLTRRFPGIQFSGLDPDRNRPVLLSHKTVSHTTI